MNVWHHLASAAATHPERPALVAGDATTSYAAAHDRALRLAAALAARGTAPGDRVACLLPNTPEHWLCYFAAAAAGAVFVPLNTRLVAEELVEILRDAGAGLLLCDADTEALAAAAATPIGVPVARVEALLPGACRGTATADGAPAFAPRLQDAGATAQLYYTSGTTGRPKGVMLSHHNVCTHARHAIAELHLRADDRWAHIAPMFHLADAWAVFAVTQAGGAHLFLPRFTPGAALDLLARGGVTITNLVPTMLTLMVAEPDAAARRYRLRVMLSGGAPIAHEVVRRVMSTFACDYVQTYGMTETSPYLTLSVLDEALCALPPEQQLAIKCRTGRPFRGVELEVVDATGAPVPRDDRAVGEIRVRGDTVTAGYWRNPVATAAAFDADGFLRTGDLATVDAHGYVNIVDRKKDVIKTGGEAVYSTEVEQVLYRHPAVLECAAYGAPDPVWGERVAVAVVLRDGAVCRAEDLIAFCREHIAAYKTPRLVRFLDALPKTGSGKISKRALRDGGGYG